MHISVCLQHEKKLSDLNKPHSLIFCHFTPQPGNRPWQTQTLSFYKLHSSLSHFQISFPDNGGKNQRQECSELVPPLRGLWGCTALISAHIVSYLQICHKYNYRERITPPSQRKHSRAVHLLALKLLRAATRGLFQRSRSWRWEISSSVLPHREGRRLFLQSP